MLREGEETLADDSPERLEKVNADIAAEDKKIEEIISSKPVGIRKPFFRGHSQYDTSSLGGSEKDAAILATGSETAATTYVLFTSVTLYATAAISVPTAATFAPVI